VVDTRLKTETATSVVTPEWWSMGSPGRSDRAIIGDEDAAAAENAIRLLDQLLLPTGGERAETMNESAYK